ncbi:MAG: DUF1788 domain-containing protein [Candidatus Wallbacteria bacterium HGW-Wallbacteria-1]|jgi:hypothetical protein|uniref:DUF1788 domain-containing protein n=1 Tax=Candidatus Wallbacteria bacterium HGW-Wallbacteria-1 TaxID=2013854 RepID=A0A2N1PNV5_9BACT|nr:MAG: DUF1788 domain-containing protein [Candidatus Wallbacteria bacterium HGW-Wallbacteria-1]
MNIKEKLDKILPRIKSRGFADNQGLGNELGFYIFDYPPTEELLVRQKISFIMKELSAQGSDISPVEIDIYKVMLKILEERKLLDKVFDMERDKGSTELLKALKPLLKADNFVKIIKEMSQGHNLIILTGIGKAWPLQRSHTILNNLHHVLDKVPVIMFFPGKWDKTSLRLFGEFKDDNYYRAFALIEN